MEHPPPVAPPVEKAPVPPQPVPLTKAERKRARTLARQARERERQDRVRAGLDKPPEPKLKLSNMMRALGEAAVIDPSAMEKKVREQMREREEQHRLRNEANKATPEERAARRVARAEKDAAAGIHVDVFRVEGVSLAGQALWKVTKNATQLGLSGVAFVNGVFGPGFSAVVAEGGFKVRVQPRVARPGAGGQERGDFRQGWAAGSTPTGLTIDTAAPTRRRSSASARSCCGASAGTSRATSSGRASPPAAT